MNEDVYKLISRHHSRLTKKQVKTLRGQVKAGDVDGAMRGLAKLLKQEDIINDATRDYSKAPLNKEREQAGSAGYGCKHDRSVF